MKIVTTDVVKIMERGQITLPKDMRRELGLKPGTLLRISSTDTKHIIIETLDMPTSPLASFLKKLAVDMEKYWNPESNDWQLNKEQKSGKKR